MQVGPHVSSQVILKGVSGGVFIQDTWGRDVLYCMFDMHMELSKCTLSYICLGFFWRGGVVHVIILPR